MPSYYEILKVPPDAANSEVEAACDALYNTWRQLLNNPDPGTVDKASLGLRMVEQMRATLMDPSRRAAYDATLNVGGLADPEALLRQAGVQSMTPLMPRQPQPVGPQGAGQSAGLWSCPKCHADNPAQTLHCYNCGTQLVRECPECKSMSSLVATGFCGQCGYKYEVAKERTDIKAAVAGIDGEMAQIQSEMAAAAADKPGSAKYGWAGLFLLLGIPFIVFDGGAPVGVVIIVGMLILIGAFAVDDGQRRKASEQTIEDCKQRLAACAARKRPLVARYDSLTIQSANDES